MLAAGALFVRTAGDEAKLTLDAVDNASRFGSGFAGTTLKSLAYLTRKAMTILLLLLGGGLALGLRARADGGRGRRPRVSRFSRPHFSAHLLIVLAALGIAYSLLPALLAGFAAISMWGVETVFRSAPKHVGYGRGLGAGTHSLIELVQKPYPRGR